MPGVAHNLFREDDSIWFGSLRGRVMTDTDTGKEKSSPWVGWKVLLTLLVPLLILAFIVPQYSDYTGRTPMGERLVLATSYKNAVADYYVNHGHQFPHGTAEEVTEQLEIPTFRPTANTRQITVSDSGVIQIEPTKKVEPGEKMIFLIPSVTDSGRIQWRCQNGTGAAALKEKNLPAECRG